jgi:hypothetical protein
MINERELRVRFDDHGLFAWFKLDSHALAQWDVQNATELARWIRRASR